MLEKSENFKSLRPILVELCKKYYGGVGPSPSRNRIKSLFPFSTFDSLIRIAPGVCDLFNKLNEICMIKYRYHV